MINLLKKLFAPKIYVQAPADKVRSYGRYKGKKELYKDNVYLCRSFMVCGVMAYTIKDRDALIKANPPERICWAFVRNAFEEEEGYIFNNHVKDI